MLEGTGMAESKTERRGVRSPRDVRRSRSSVATDSQRHERTAGAMNEWRPYSRGLLFGALADGIKEDLKHLDVGLLHVSEELQEVRHVLILCFAGV